MMKTFAHIALTIAAAFTLGSATLSAGPINPGMTPVSVIATADTFITTTDAFGGASTPQGSDGFLYAVPYAGGESIPLMQFDLAAYSGSTVVGPVTLTLDVEATWEGQSGLQTLALNSILVPWDPATATWNSLGGLTNLAVAPAGSDSVTVTPGSEVVLTLSDALVQSWIDSPGTNYGVALTQNSDLIHPDIVFASSGSSAPTLDFTLASSAVPEPGTSTLLAGAFLIFAGKFMHGRRSKG
jgi:hypothetical protein